MIQTWAYTLISVVIVSLISLVGIITIPFGQENLRRMLFFLVSFSAGALLGDTFIHIMPEIAEKYGFGLQISFCIILGMLLFFVLEKFMHWRHCHVPTSKSHPHPLAFMNLVGDAFHNLIDGMVIAGSYLVSVQLGIATTLAVVFHEIPQEIGDFGVLLHSGFTKTRALFFNFLSALTAVAGAIAVLMLGAKTQNITSFLMPFTAGGFLYIAGSDLIPEMHKEVGARKSVMQLIGLVLGILVMVALLMIE